MLKMKVMMGFGAVMVLAMMVLIVAGQENRGEPVSVQTLTAEGLEAALNLMKGKLLVEGQKIAKDAADEMGVAEVLEDFDNNKDEFLDWAEGKYDAFVTYIDDEDNLDKLFAVFGVGAAKLVDFYNKVLGVCGESDDGSGRRVLLDEIPTSEEDSDSVAVLAEDFANMIAPTSVPSKSPSFSPTISPTKAPTPNPSRSPTSSPVEKCERKENELEDALPKKWSFRQWALGIGFGANWNIPIGSSGAKFTVNGGFGFEFPMSKAISKGGYVGFGVGLGLARVQCATGYYCPDGDQGDPIICPAGYYCPKATLKVPGTSLLCDEGYYCPEGSTESTGKPKTAVGSCAANAQCKCAIGGKYCPRGSTQSNGYSVVDDIQDETSAILTARNTVGDCPAGYYCSGDGTKTMCPEGSYCAAGVASETACNVAKFFCPDYSTTSKGRPRVTVKSPLDDTVDICTENADCDCPKGFKCTGDGKYVKCDAGFFCAVSTETPVACAEGYFCPEYSTENTGKPLQSATAAGCDKGAQCECGKGFYCPQGSKTSTGGICGGTTAKCNCKAGYWCPKTSTTETGNPVSTQNVDSVACSNDCVCKAGYYCLANSASPLGILYSSGATANLCKAPNWCPPGSTSDNGKPAIASTDTNVGLCGIDEECSCKDGFFCPTGSTTEKGKPINTITEKPTCTSNGECACPAGYYCENGVPAECPEGRFCDGGNGPVANLANCEAGFYCPKTSTSSKGKPILGCDGSGDYSSNPASAPECGCDAGYWCPESSVKATGEPITGTGDCSSGAKCYCAPGYFCPTKSTTKLGVVTGTSTSNECTAKFFCPEGSTTGNGQPVKESSGTFSACGVGNLCNCISGSYCGTGSPTGTRCPAGYYCPASQDDTTYLSKKCGAGSFCPETSTTDKGQPKDADPLVCSGICECETGYYCPEGSTTKKGNPLYGCDNSGLMNDPSITANQCSCLKGYFCPDSSTTEKGKPLLGSSASCPTNCGTNSGGICGECACPPGYYCTEGSTLNSYQKCKAGTYCPGGNEEETGQPCMEGKWCPVGSTSENGEPVETVSGTTTSASCTKDQPCKCSAGFYCPAGSAKSRGYPLTNQGTCTMDTACKCSAGYFCAEESTTGTPADKLCSKDFFCPETSTESTGKPVLSFSSTSPAASCHNTDCLCAAKYFCPAGSSSPDGYPVTGADSRCGQDSQCKCQTGYYCTEGSGELNCPAGYYCPIETSAPIPCDQPGYFCPLGSTDPKGSPLQSTAYCGDKSGTPGTGTCYCKEGHFCPATSTSYEGRPTMSTTNCVQGGICSCGNGYVCPSTAKTYQGAPAETDGTCPVDSICLCPEGYYCKERQQLNCAAGYFCPPGSTNSKGNPVADGGNSDCQSGDCKCRSGYYCPQKSIDDTGIIVETMASHVCAQGYYCPMTSTTSQGKPAEIDANCNVDTPCICADSACDGYTGCVDNKCTGTATRRLLLEKVDAFMRKPIKAEIEVVELNPLETKPRQIVHAPRTRRNVTVERKNYSRDHVLKHAQAAIEETQSARRLAKMEEEETNNVEESSGGNFDIGRGVKYTKGGNPARVVEMWDEMKPRQEQPDVKVVFVENEEEFAPEGEDAPVKQSKVNIIIDKEGDTFLGLEKDDGRIEFLTKFDWDDVDEFEANATRARILAGSPTASPTPAPRSGFSKFLDYVKTHVDGEVTFSVVLYFDQFNEYSGFGGWEFTFVKENSLLSGFSIIFDGSTMRCRNDNDNLQWTGWSFFGEYLFLPVGVKLDFDLVFLYQDLGLDVQKWKENFVNGWKDVPFDGIQVSAGGGSHFMFFADTDCNPFLGSKGAPDCPDRRMLRGNNNRRANSRDLGANQYFEELMNFAGIVERTRDYSQDFCIGDCSSDDYGRKLNGTLSTSLSDSCTDIGLAVQSELISAVGIIYIILREVSDSAANTVSSFLGPIAELGLADVAVVVNATFDPSIKIKVVGSPSLPDADDLPDGTGKMIYGLLETAAESVNFAVTAQLTGFSRFDYELAVGMDPLYFSDEVAMVSSATPPIGARVFQRGAFTQLTTTPVPEQSFGISLPLRICVSDCTGDNEPSYIYLIGEVAGEIVPGNTRFGATLTLEGVWPSVFGINFVHIGNAIIGASFSPLTFPIPDSMVFGAYLCVGLEDNCVGDADGPTVEMMSYVSYDVAVPANNYFVAMSRGLFVRNILSTMGSVEDVFLDLRDMLPDFVLDTGLYPYDESCDDLSDESIANGESTIDTSCWAMFSFAPFGEVPDVIPTTEAVELSLAQGLGLSGKVNLFNVVVFRLEALIDVFDPAAGTTFMVDVEMDRIQIPSASSSFLEIGARMEGSHAVGGARFYVFASTKTLEFATNISGAIAIPFIKTYGEVQLEIDSDGAFFNSEINVFGGIINPMITCEWKWDFSYFYLHIQEISFSFVFYIEEILMVLDTDPGDTNGVEFLFTADITVLMLASIEGSFWMKQQSEDIYVRFEVTGEAASLAEVTVKGNAMIDTQKITDSDFGSFSVSFAPGGLAKDIAAAAKAGVKAIKNVVNSALDAGQQLVDGIVDGINALGEAIDFIRDAFADAFGDITFDESLEKLKDGDLLGAASDFGSEFAKVFEKDRWEDLGITLLSGIGLIGKSAKGDPYPDPKGAKDQWGCVYLYQKVEVKLKTRFCVAGICTKDIKLKTETKGPFSDETCVNQKKALLDDVTADLEEADSIGTGRDDTKNGNKGLLNFDDIPEAQYPQFPDLMEVAVPQGNERSSVTFSGSSPKLSTSDDTVFTSSKQAFSSSVAMDFSSMDNFESSLESVSATVGNKVKDVLTSTQALVTESLEKHVGERALVPLVIRMANTVTEVWCENVQSAWAIKPIVQSSDSSCGNVRMKLDRWSEVPSSNPNHICGSYVQTRIWVARDACGRTSNEVTQTLIVKNRRPAFNFTPPDWEVDTESDLFDFDLYLNATAEGFCENNVNVEWDDDDEVVAVTDESGCTSWQYRRTWTAFNSLDDPRCTSSAITHVQLFEVEDITAPNFVSEVPAEVVIPFFNNYAYIPPPIIDDTPGNAFFAQQGSANTMTLTSSDSVMTYPMNEPTCTVDGRAQFTRTWTATDSCANSRTLTQNVIIQHPPTVLQNTKALEAGLYAKTAGVSQLANACRPGKDVILGNKEYLANNDWDDTYHNCAGVWDENGCRLSYIDPGSETIELLAVKPEFETVPDDIQIYTNQSILPENTGKPVEKSYCDAPFEILYLDDEPEPVPGLCGVWTVQRHWYIRPQYADCESGVPLTDTDLVSTYVQTITVVDIFSPDFIYKPEDKEVYFLENYGPDATEVPQAKDFVYHESLIGRYGLEFYSYPIEITYTDVVEFTKNAEDVCDDSLAEVSRTWATSDRCGYTETFVQTITITRPRTPLFSGSASSFQVVGNKVQLRDGTSIAQDVASGGSKFGMWQSTIENKCSVQNGSPFTLVVEECPQTYVHSDVNGAIEYGWRTYGKKRERAECDSLADHGHSVSGVKPNKNSVDFRTLNADILASSDTLATGLPDLLTGSKLITCSETKYCTQPNQLCCSDVEMSISPTQNNVNSVNAQGDLILEGDQLLYNMFTVPLHIWFAPTSELGDKVVDVRARGFVIVNVIDHVMLELNETNPDELFVLRDFGIGLDDEELYACTIGSANENSMPLFGNYDADSDNTYAYKTRNVQTASGLSEAASSHLLVNILTQATFGDGVIDSADVAACTGLRYRFSKEHETNYLVGTYVVSNQHSSMQIWDYVWQGGQLITNTAASDIRNVVMECGMYLPNVACP